MDETDSIPAAQPTSSVDRPTESTPNFASDSTSPVARGAAMPLVRRTGRRLFDSGRGSRPGRSSPPPEPEAPSLSVRLADLLRPLTVATANAVRRSRVELTVYRSDGGIEATTGFGLTDDEREIVSRLVATWGRRLRQNGLAAIGLQGFVINGARPPGPAIERATDPSLPSELRSALMRIGRETATLIPLVSEGEVVGRLSAWSPGDSRPLAQSALLAATAIGEQAGLTIRAARRLSAAERRLAEQTALLRLGQSVSAETDLTEALANLARAGLGVAGAEGCSIELLLAGGHECIVAGDEVVMDWEAAVATGTRYPLALAPALAGALRTGAPWMLAPDDSALGPSLAARFNERRVGRALLVPIVLADQTFGGAILTWRGRRGRPNLECELGRDYANQVAQVLDRLRLAAALRLRAAFDAATGLPNRAAIVAQLHAEIARAARRGDRLAVAVVQAGSEMVGPSAGDADATRRLASLLRSTLRAADLVGLIGVDEYLLILPETDARRAQSVAARVEARAAEVVELAALRLGFGFAGYPEDGATADALIARARHRSATVSNPTTPGTRSSEGRGDNPPVPAQPALPYDEIEAALIGSVA